MKIRSQTITSDGFDKNVAEKMPKIKRVDESYPLDREDLESEPQALKEDRHEVNQQVSSPEKQAERKVIFEPPKRETDSEQSLNVLKLIEDLHTQLLVSSRAKKALEMDLISYQKTIHQLAQDNKDLRNQLDGLNKELQALKEIQYGSIYLKEENEDALEKIQEFQQELRAMKETLSITTKEKDEAFDRIHELESRIDQNELLLVRGKLKEREVSHFYEENRDLQSKLEETLTQNMDLERKYEALKKSFNEVRESLTLLRDSCKTSFYSQSEGPE